MLKAIIFDMDGVLVDSEGIHHNAEEHVFAEFGVRPTREEWASFKGTTDKSIFSHIQKTYLPHIALEDLLAKKQEIVLSVIRENVKEIPGSVAFVKSLRGKYKLALATSSNTAQRDATLSVFGLTPYFDALISADDVERGKPDPEPYLKVILLLGVDVSECVVIEDSINGMKSARAAGAKVIGITTSFTADVIRPYCDWVVGSYQEVKKIVNSLS